jgi:hypothetical protein
LAPPESSTLVSTGLRVPALPEILADLVVVADGLPRSHADASPR